jgi:2-phospho-L-lactate/phosphoenolpyruvate guanylyltransferase
VTREAPGPRGTARGRGRAPAIVAVPVKDLVNAKQRLVPILAAHERRALATTMLEDVLTALTGSAVEAVWVVTRDPDVDAIARRFGATVVLEAANRGHTAAVADAQARAREQGVAIFATIPGDVPCVTAAEVDALVSVVDGGPAVALVPSRSGLGTNGVALAPPDALTLRFGEPSFAGHVAGAQARGMIPRVLHLPGLGLDVDGPDDLHALLARGGGTRSAQLLADWRLGSRTA